MSDQEAPDELSDLIRVCFQGKMPGIEQMDLCGGKVTLVGLGTRRDECWIMSAPDRQEWWLMIPEICLKLFIPVDVCSVVEDKIKLNVFRTRPRHERDIKLVAIGRKSLF